MQDDIQEMTLRIYDAVADASVWSSVLDRLVDRIGAQGSIIFEWADTDAARALRADLHSDSYSQEAVALYLEKCAHLEAADQDIVRDHTGAHDEIDLIDDTLIAKTKDALLQQEHVQKLQRLGILHRAAGVMNKDNRWISLFSVQLKAERPPLNPEERDYVQRLLPHLAKALDLSLPMRQLHTRHRAVMNVLNRLKIGVCILDGQGNVAAKNEEFRRQVETFNTFDITSSGHLTIADAEGQKRFARLKEDVRAHGTFGARPRKESFSNQDNAFLCIELVPLDQVQEIGSARFGGYMLTSTDTSLPIQCNTARIREAYGLTEAEEALVEAIGAGLTNAQIAERRERSVATVNAQVKSILAKAQCSNRTQFVRAMTRFGSSFVSAE